MCNWISPGGSQLYIFFCKWIAWEKLSSGIKNRRWLFLALIFFKEHSEVFTDQKFLSLNDVTDDYMSKTKNVSILRWIKETLKAGFTEKRLFFSKKSWCLIFYSLRAKTLKVNLFAQFCRGTCENLKLKLLNCSNKINYGASKHFVCGQSSQKYIYKIKIIFPHFEIFPDQLKLFKRKKITIWIKFLILFKSL